MIVPSSAKVVMKDGVFTSDKMEAYLNEDHLIGTGNVHIVSAPRNLEAFGDQHLIVAHSIEVAGVEQGDPGVHGRRHRGEALLAIRGAVEVGHAHAAEAEGGGGGAGGAQFANVHRVILHEVEEKVAPRWLCDNLHSSEQTVRDFAQ